MEHGCPVNYPNGGGRLRERIQPLEVERTAIHDHDVESSCFGDQQIEDVDINMDFLKNAVDRTVVIVDVG